VLEWELGFGQFVTKSELIFGCEREMAIVGTEDRLPVLSGFSVAACWADAAVRLRELVCGRVLHLEYPYTWPLMKLGIRLGFFACIGRDSTYSIVRIL